MGGIIFPMTPPPFLIAKPCRPVSFREIMKTPLALSAGVLLGIAIGVVVGRAGLAVGGAAAGAEADGAGADARRVSSRAAAGGRRAESSAELVLSALLKGRAVSEISAEEAYRFIQPQLEMDNHGDPLENARIHYQFRLLTSRLPLPVLEELMVKSKENGISAIRINQIFSTYAARDWDKAMAWAAGQPDSENLRAGAIAGLAHVDPERAATLFEKELLEGRGQSGMWEASMSLSAAAASQGPEAFFRFIDSMPSATVSNMMHNGARNIPKEQIPAFLEQLDKRVEAGTVDKSVVGYLMPQIASTHPEEVRDWLGKMQVGPERSRGEFNLATQLASMGRTAEAEAMITEAMAGLAGQEKEFVKRRMPILIQRNPQLAEKLITLFPEGVKLTPTDAEGWSKQFYGRPDGVVDVARLFTTPEEKATYLVGSFKDLNRNMNDKDFKILAHRIESLGLTGDDAARTKEALEAARAKTLKR